MTEHEEIDWRSFQDRVAALLSTIPGSQVVVGDKLHGARIGTVEIDVTARIPLRTFANRAARMTFLVVVECKFWRTRIPQEKIFALKTVVEDVGAAMGILLSEVGVQNGVTDYIAKPGNVLTLTFMELRALVEGRYLGKCGRCGSEELLPFEPDPDRMWRLLCKKCHRERIAYKGGA